MVKLIDTHQHLVYPDVAGYGWTDGIAPLANKAFSLERYAELTAGHDVVGTLFMETGVDDADYKTEARHVSKLSQNHDSGIVGLIASCRPEDDAGFDDWLDECDDLGVVGFRRVLHVMPDDLSTASVFRKNLRVLGKRGKPFDLCVLPTQLQIGADLAGACEGTTFILNHCGVPDIGGSFIDPWRADITALAALPNVYCKVSGLLAYCAPGRATQETIQPYFDHALEAFGPSRMVWGSDWPVVDLANGLPDWLAVTQSMLGALSDDEADAIGSGTARKIFDLTVNCVRDT